MLIELIIIGVVITLQEHFLNEWIESLNHISGNDLQKRILSFSLDFRASEILFSMAHAKMLEQKTISKFPNDKLFNLLVTARRNLGVFQHHDGVTGTAKDHVVNDYGLKYQTSIVFLRIN
jgi:hypothetical protein